MAEETTEEVETGGGSKKKTFIVVGGLLAVEAVVLALAFTLFAGEPQVAAGSGIEQLSEAELEAERIVEIEVLDEKLPNAKRGVTYIYDTRIYVQVRNRYAEQMQRELDQFRNEIKADIAGLWRTSDPRVFSEPRLETINRKLSVMFQDRLGTAPETGEPVVEKVVIVLGAGFRVDS
ncbi:MAG: hypothetical protein AB8G96_14335 [Phycisphaerales bacterium]